MNTADAIIRTLESSNVCDSNGEIANVVDTLNALATAANRIAFAIRPRNTGAGKDGVGNTIDSLTEAVMGTTDGLVQIADAIRELAEAVRHRE